MFVYDVEDVIGFALIGIVILIVALNIVKSAIVRCFDAIRRVFKHKGEDGGLS